MNQPALSATTVLGPNNDTYTDDTFVVSTNGKARVCFTYIGEGYEGEYDETDPEDAALYRLDVNVSAAHYTPETHNVEVTGDPDWVYPDDGSICTVVHVDDLTNAVAHDLLFYAANAIADAIDNGSVKGTMDALSYLPSKR